MARRAPLALALALALAAGAVRAEHAGGGAPPALDAARAAAQADRNAESARLFAAVLRAHPDLRPAILREYADQLTYSGRAAQAVPLYREVLDRDLPTGDAARARRGLALALLWSGRHAAAAEAWAPIHAADPADADARGNLRAALIGAARAAARGDRNAEAAALFGRAVALDPSRRLEILKEYADQLTYAGQPARAVAEYDALRAAGQDGGGVARGRALALLWAGEHEAAIAAWRRLYRDDPDDADARRNLLEAYAAAGRAAATGHRNRLAADLLAQAMRLDPEGETAIAVEYAEQLTYSERAQAAVPVFRAFLNRDNLGPEAARRARMGLALALSWSDDLAAARAEYRRILARDPGDAAALKGEARVLVWMDRLRAARDRYRAALVAAPGDEEALRGLAQTESYLGRQRGALDRLGPVLQSGKAAPETLMVAARAELWKGRPDKAAALVERVITTAPDYAQAGDLLAEIQAQRRPVTSVTLRGSTQSDDLAIRTLTFRQSQTLNTGLTTLGLQYRALRFDPADGAALDLSGPGAFARHRFSDMFEVNASVYANRIEAPGVDRDAATWDVWATVWPGDRLRLDLSAGRGFFDDIRSLSSNIRIDTYGLSADFRPVPEVTLSGRASHGELTDGNSRAMLQAEAEGRVKALGEFFLGGTVTHFDFARPELWNGYFNPDWYTSTKAKLRYSRSFGTIVEIGARASLGYEWKPGDQRPIWAAGLSAAHDLGGKTRLVGEVSHFDASSLADGDGFHRTSASVNLVYRW